MDTKEVKLELFVMVLMKNPSNRNKGTGINSVVASENDKESDKVI